MYVQFELSENWLCEGGGEAAVLVDDVVDLFHQADGSVYSDDDFLVVGDVFVG